MKKRVFEALTIFTALVMGFCAYSTIDDGRALNAQERMLGGMLVSFTTHCRVCTPGVGGTDCTYQKAIADQSCSELGAYESWCDGTKGDGRKCSKTRDVYTFGNPDGDTACVRWIYACVQAGDETNHYVWQRTDLFAYDGCGSYTDCNDETTSNPKKCEEECGGGGVE